MIPARSATPHSFSLSLAAVDILLEHGKLGRAPVPFVLPHVGTTHTQRAQIREAVFRDLDGRGVLYRGRLEPEVEQALRTLTDAPLAIAAAAYLEGKRSLFARVAAADQYAVLVRQEENLLVFEQVRPTGIVPAIVDLLPLTPAAVGQSVTVAKPAVRQPARRDESTYDPFAGVAAPRTHESSQLRTVERIFEKPRLRVGQFTAIVRGRHGREIDLSPLAWFDTEAGRYLMTSRDAADGQSWLTYAPADNARIAQQLHGQLEGYFQS